MGYNIRAGFVEENASILEIIKQSLESGTEARFDVPSEELYSQQYKMRRILVATEVLRTEAGGDYADLGQKVTISVDRQRSQVVVSLKSHLTELRLAKIDERDALKKLQSYEGSLVMMEFYPSAAFDEDQFAEVCLDEGWKVHYEALNRSEDGKWRLPAERVSEGDVIDAAIGDTSSD